jgi:hypothetical protein
LLTLSPIESETIEKYSFPKKSAMIGLKEKLTISSIFENNCNLVIQIDFSIFEKHLSLKKLKVY